MFVELWRKSCLNSIFWEELLFRHADEDRSCHLKQFSLFGYWWYKKVIRINADVICEEIREEAYPIICQVKKKRRFVRLSSPIQTERSHSFRSRFNDWKLWLWWFFSLMFHSDNAFLSRHHNSFASNWFTNSLHCFSFFFCQLLICKKFIDCSTNDESIAFR